MSNRWGHPVATLPVTNETIRHIRRMTKILRIKLQEARPCDTEWKPYGFHVLKRSQRFLAACCSKQRLQIFCRTTSPNLRAAVDCRPHT
eukprot:234044-Pleurochrysis_carterae.AAC.1